jgi:hypothetical protein
VNIRLRRDGLHVRTMRQEGPTLVVRDRRFPPHPKVYGHSVAIEPDTINVPTVVEAVTRCIWQAQDMDKALPRGLDFQTLELFVVEPVAAHPEMLVAWKAQGR